MSRRPVRTWQHGILQIFLLLTKGAIYQFSKCTSMSDRKFWVKLDTVLSPTHIKKLYLRASLDHWHKWPHRWCLSVHFVPVVCRWLHYLLPAPLSISCCMAASVISQLESGEQFQILNCKDLVMTSVSWREYFLNQCFDISPPCHFHSMLDVREWP